MHDELQKRLETAKVKYHQSMTLLQLRGVTHIVGRHKDLIMEVEAVKSESTDLIFQNECNAFLVELKKSGVISPLLSTKRSTYRV